MQQIRKGLANGARLIVIDPRRIPLAEKADIWLQIRPGSDLLLALSLIHVMLAEGLHDPAFTRDWTTAPLLVREDTGDLLSSGDLAQGHAPGGQVMVAEESGTLVCNYPGRLAEEAPALEQSVTVALKDGTSVACKTVFALLREHVAAYSPEDTADRTGLAASRVREAARLFVGAGPSCMYTFNGIEQTINATHTNRAVCMLYALTGCYDRKGGSVLFPEAPVKEMGGRNLLPAEAAGRRLGRAERPLGPAAVPGAVRANDVYSAILDETPYPVKALVGNRRQRADLQPGKCHGHRRAEEGGFPRPGGPVHEPHGPLCRRGASGEHLLGTLGGQGQFRRSGGDHPHPVPPQDDRAHVQIQARYRHHLRSGLPPGTWRPFLAGRYRGRL